MEVTLNTEELSQAVQIVERIVSTRTTLPIIGNILFEIILFMYLLANKYGKSEKPRSRPVK